MRKHFTILLTIILLLFVSVPVLAEIRVSASLSQQTAEVGESVTLIVEIQGDINVPAPNVRIPGCEVQYYGPSKQVSIVNGQRSESVGHLYAVTPGEAGTVTIPPIQITVNSRTYQTEPVQFNVADGQSNTSLGSGNPMDDLVFLEAEVGRNQVYLNEEIPLTVKLYSQNEVLLQNVNYPEVKSDNFLVEPFPEPEQTMEYRNGRAYQVIIFRTTVKALKAGKLDLGTIRLTTDVSVPRSGRSMRSFFSSGYDYQSLNLQAPHQSIEIRNFPVQGKPADFKGAVGQFQMDVTVNPDSAKPGEPITIRSRITGQGSFDTVTAPVPGASSEFKFYDPQDVTPKPAQGQATPAEKIFEQIVIPNAGAAEIPAMRFSYFDPVDERYKTLTHEPVPVRISGDTDQRQIADYRKGQQTPEVLGEDIVYIKNRPGRFRALGQSPFASPGFAGYNLAVLVLLGGGIFLRRRQNHESPAERQRKETVAQTQRILTDAEGLIHSGKPMEFYEMVYQGVQNYLKGKYQIAVTGISSYETECLQKAGVSAEHLAMIQQFYRSIDEKRFAGAFGTEAEMRQVLDLARQMVHQIENGEVA